MILPELLESGKKIDLDPLSIHTRYSQKIEKVSVCKTSNHGEVGDRNENPTILGLCT
jgi:hypothetical protein